MLLSISDIDKLHTTVGGEVRIRRNLGLTNVVDPVEYCRQQILDNSSSSFRKGKNWYVISERCKITINASSLTIITAHKK